MRRIISLLFGCLLAAGCATDAKSKSAKTYSNPLEVAKDIADPHVIRVNDVYYLYATTHSRGYDVYLSRDLVTWTNAGTVFSGRRGAWAPDVFHNVKGDGKFYLYYTDDADPTRPTRKRIGVAVADSPQGPFTDKGTLVMEAIDAHVFRDDDGKFYFYYANLKGGFKMMGQAMTDPLTLAGEPRVLFQPTEPWEMTGGNVTEGPFMLKHKGTYYLMYSGSPADTADYAIGYATAKHPLGPFKKYEGNPVVHRSETVFGPGHHCVTTGPKGDLWLVYHQKWEAKKTWGRFLAIDPMHFDQAGVIRARATRGEELPAP